MPAFAAFAALVEGVQIDPGYEWQPCSEPSVDARAVGSFAVVGVLGAFLVAGVSLGVAIALGAMSYSRIRRRRTGHAAGPGMLQPVAPGPSKRWARTLGNRTSGLYPVQRVTVSSGQPAR